jgi:hypothetical protein
MGCALILNPYPRFVGSAGDEKKEGDGGAPSSVRAPACNFSLV